MVEANRALAVFSRSRVKPGTFQGLGVPLPAFTRN